MSINLSNCHNQMSCVIRVCRLTQRIDCVLIFSIFLQGAIQRWKTRQTLQTSLCYFSQLVLIFRPRARKTMREECFTHFIISTRAISTSAISINNACSCYLQICHTFIGHLRCFVANLLVLIFVGLFCICAILIAFSISGAI